MGKYSLVWKLQKLHIFISIFSLSITKVILMIKFLLFIPSFVHAISVSNLFSKLEHLGCHNICIVCSVQIKLVPSSSCVVNYFCIVNLLHKNGWNFYSRLFIKFCTLCTNILTETVRNFIFGYMHVKLVYIERCDLCMS